MDDVSLHIAPGEILGLVGLNGAGKTTVIRVCAGLSMATTGSVTVAGYDIARDKTEVSRHLGLVPEFPNFDPGSRPLALLRYFSGFFGLRGQEATQRCSKLLDLVGLADTTEVKVRAFSQGMKKRLALAAALLHDPEVILLDEVLNGLDPEGVALVRSLMLQWREEGKAIMLSSHLLGEMEQVADRVAIVHHGRLVKVLSRVELEANRSATLQVNIRNLDERAKELLARYGTVRADGRGLRISRPTLSANEINALLVGRGYQVDSLSFEPNGLEALFLGLIKEPPSTAAQGS